MAVSDTLIGSVFDGRYRIERKLGAGGMADVYFAEDQELGRRVAIKILNDRHAADDSFIERFRREAKNAAALSHPNIVSIYDRGEAEGTYYIAMEFLDGRSLKELIVGRGPAPIKLAIDYARQVLAAVGFAHKHGIVHRDIKPHHVLVGPEGRLKVTDFGIARSGASQMTEVGSIIGTAQYLSPEQARGAPVDQTSERYKSAEKMDAALARVAEGLPVDPETETMATAVLSGSGLMAAAPTSVITRPAGTAPTRAAPPGRTPPAGYYGYEGPPRRRRPVWPWVLAVLLLLAAAGAAWFAYTKIQDQLDQNKPVAVPLVKGITEQLAVQKIQGAGLNPAVARDFSDAVPKGTVIDQNPQAGDHVQKHTNVQITVSKGKETVKVPSVIGLSRDAAITTLANAGLDPHAFDVNSTKEVGTVPAQDPPAGQVVEKGSKVRINVSSGPADVTVPSVVGMTYDQASRTLRNQGFQVSRVDVDSEEAKGTVVDQSPSGSAAPGSTIQLSVSKGPKQSTVPDVTSQDEASARSTLESAGFKVVVQRQDVNDPGLVGIVLSQSPSPGTQAPQNSTVTIVVGRQAAAEPPPPPATP